jgi:hypothetical protein
MKRAALKRGWVWLLCLLAGGCGQDKTPIKTVSDGFLTSYAVVPYRVSLVAAPRGPAIEVTRVDAGRQPRTRLRVFLRRWGDDRRELDAFLVQYPGARGAELPPLESAQTRSFLEKAAPAVSTAAAGLRVRPQTWSALDSSTVCVMDRRSVGHATEGLIDVRFRNDLPAPADLDPAREGFWAAVWGAPGRLAIFLDENMDGSPEVAQYARIDSGRPLGLELVARRPGRRGVPFVFGRAVAAPFRWLAGAGK